MAILVVDVLTKLKSPCKIAIGSALFSIKSSFHTRKPHIAAAV